jgi:hypothetical protein
MPRPTASSRPGHDPGRVPGGRIGRRRSHSIGSPSFISNRSWRSTPAAHPARPSSAAAGRELLPGAIEEFLRYESSLKFSTGRTAIEDFELGGQEIKAGDVVMVSLLAVNRDPQRFEAPKTNCVSTVRRTPTWLSATASTGA